MLRFICTTALLLTTSANAQNSSRPKIIVFETTQPAPMVSRRDDNGHVTINWRAVESAALGIDGSNENARFIAQVMLAVRDKTYTEAK